MTMNIQLPSISVVMPCLNEECNVEAAARAVLKAFDRRGVAGELIIVNDGSTDRTQQVAEAIGAQDSRVRVFRHEIRQGIGVSFFDGVRLAQKECVVYMPGDNENDPDDALTYLHLANDVDIIVPFIYNVEIRSKWRRIVSSVFRFIVNMSFGTNLNYTNGTTIYRTAIVRQVELSTNGFFYQAELLVKLIRRGYLYAETPHFLANRSTGVTKALSLRSVREVTRSYVRMVLEIHILRSAGATGLPLDPGSATYRRLQSLQQ
jgi:glycosyltransferase involved in cell wall biosynthesis